MEVFLEASQAVQSMPNYMPICQFPDAGRSLMEQWKQMVESNKGYRAGLDFLKNISVTGSSIG